MATRVQILAAPEIVEGKSKTGNDYRMAICQCVVMQEGEPPAVAELILPRNHPEVVAGLYEAVFGAYIDRQSKRLGGQLIRLVPVGK